MIVLDVNRLRYARCACPCSRKAVRFQMVDRGADIDRLMCPHCERRTMRVTHYIDGEGNRKPRLELVRC